MDEVRGWLAGRLPEEWFHGDLEVSVDREEMLVVGELPQPAADGDESVRRASEAGLINRFREETREQRMRITKASATSAARSPGVLGAATPVSCSRPCRCR